MGENKLAPLTLTKEQMKACGYKVIDLIVDHFETVHEKKHAEKLKRNAVDAMFEPTIPYEATEPGAVLKHIQDTVLQNVDMPSHPKFYSFVPSPSNYISVMADTLATGYNIFSGGWTASPSAAKIEILAINWLLEMFNFPIKTGGGIFTSGGSMANLTALVTARRVKCGDDFSKAVIYLSDQTHSSNIKAIRVLGFKKEQVRIIPTDLEFKLSINKLKNEIARDRLKGLQPFCIIANAGTTNTGTVDPLNQIAKICKKENLWMHVDGAYGGGSILSEQGADYLRGIEKADSLTIDPHKWFFQPYEIGCLLVKNHKHLSDTFTEKPEYLRDIEGNESEINFYDYGIQLTRRFRALKFYMSIKTFGLNAFKEAVQYSVDLTESLEDKLRESAKWEIISPATLAVINFRYNPIVHNLNEKQLDEINQYISQKVVDSRDAVFVTTVLMGQVVLRMCLINPRTTMEDIVGTIQQCDAYGQEYLKLGS
jgi:glutamate/tyrosine decarboxylase-like PLP-dependent enzyme